MSPLEIKMSYAQQLKLAMSAQEQDLEELIPRNLGTFQRSAVQKQPEEINTREKNRETAPITIAPSLAQLDLRKQQLQAEAKRREVMMEEISLIHCSGTRDKNTSERH
jgi:hypothetical protein